MHACIYLSGLVHLYAASLQFRSSECSEYDPSEKSLVVSTLSLNRLQLSGTNSLFLSVILLLSVLLNLPSKPFFFQKPFLQSHCPDMICVCVCARARVRGCAFMLYALNFDNMYL